MIEKPKVDKPSQSRVNRYGFLALWVGAQLAGWLAFFLFSNYYFGYFLPSWSEGLILGLVIGIPTTIGQKLSLYLHFGRWFRGWFRTNTIAWALGGAVMLFGTRELGINGNERIGILIQILSLMLLPTLAQMWILRNYVQRLWLWLLATVAATSVFGAVFGLIGASNNSAFPAFGLYALVTGITLLWLVGMQSEVGKQKLGRAEDFRRLEDDSEEMGRLDGILSAQDSVKSAEND